MLAGGLRRRRQQFNATAASVQATMLLLAAGALVLPAIFQLVSGGGLPKAGTPAVRFSADLQQISVGVAAVLLLVYGAGLLFSLRTHRDLFNPEHDDDHVGVSVWSVRRSVLVLAVAGAAVGIMSELLVGSITEASQGLGLSTFFVGIIVVAVVGNAAEHWVAITFALRGKLDLSVNIAIGSSAQIALFVAPVLVLVSFVLGPFPLALVFNGFELAAIVLAVLVAGFIAQRGESTWFDGLQLLALYALLAIVFLYVS
jgi:Ca2+:H+ antiporter